VPPSHTAVASQTDRIEAEMRRVGLWQETPLPDEAYEFEKAFGMDTMTFTQWLQFVFVPRVRELVDSEGEFPSSSQVGVQAFRELDGQPEANGLVILLSEFDALFD